MQGGGSHPGERGLLSTGVLLRWGGEEQGWVKTPQSFPASYKLAFFLIRCSHDDCKPSTLF